MTAGYETTTDYYLPFYVVAPGKSDTLLFVIAGFMIVVFVSVGIIYFRLHSIPEQMAHKSENKVQFQIVAVLGLLALFTHNNAFWVAALLLAMVRIPDITTPLLAIADGIIRLGQRRGITTEPGAAVISEAPRPTGVPLLPGGPKTDTGGVDSSQLSPTPSPLSVATDSGQHSSATS